MQYQTIMNLINAIQAVETWAVAINNEWANGNTDFERIEQLEKYLVEAKQKVFDIANQ